MAKKKTEVRPLVIWLIEDKPDDEKHILECMEERNKNRGKKPLWKFRTFSDVQDAGEADGSPDFILLDIAALTAGGLAYGRWFDMDDYMRQAGALFERHTSASIGVYSWLEGFAHDVTEEVTRLCGHVTVVSQKHDCKTMIEFIEKYSGYA